MVCHKNLLLFYWENVLKNSSWVAEGYIDYGILGNFDLDFNTSKHVQSSTNNLGYMSRMCHKWVYLLIADFFATQIIGGAKELVVLEWLSGDI